MVTNILLVCDAQHFLFVCVHLFVSFENMLVIVHNITFVTGLQATVETTPKCFAMYVSL